jgi:hypothetical protein
MSPGVYITYSPDQFLTISNSTIVQAQAYRLDPAASSPEPVAVHFTSSGDSMADLGTTATGAINTSAMGPPDASLCPAIGPDETAGPFPFNLGVSYQYEVQIIYEVSALDLPTPGGTGNCYFVTNAAISSGAATPLGQIPTPTNPTSNSQVNINTPIQFQFPSILANSSNPFVADYIVEVSTQSTFPAGATAVYPRTPVQSTSTNPVSLPAVTIASLLPNASNASTFFFRYGVRNDSDSPGPYPDSLGERFLFSPTVSVPITSTP